MEKDYYQILNVPPAATQEQIKRAYIKQVKQFHPDMNPKDPQSDERTKSINEAYAVLKDRRLRRRYDRMRGQGRIPDGAATNEFDGDKQPFFDHLHSMMYFKKNPRALKNFALNAFNHGNYSLAGSLLERGINISPGDHELYMGLSWCLFHQGRYDQCARVLEKLLTLNPKNVDAWFNLSWLQETGGDLPGALRSLQTARVHFPDMTELKERIADIEQKMG